MQRESGLKGEEPVDSHGWTLVPTKDQKARQKREAKQAKVRARVQTKDFWYCETPLGEDGQAGDSCRRRHDDDDDRGSHRRADTRNKRVVPGWDPLAVSTLRNPSLRPTLAPSPPPTFGNGAIAPGGFSYRGSSTAFRCSSNSQGSSLLSDDGKKKDDDHVATCVEVRCNRCTYINSLSLSDIFSPHSTNDEPHQCELCEFPLNFRVRRPTHDCAAQQRASSVSSSSSVQSRHCDDYNDVCLPSTSDASFPSASDASFPSSSDVCCPSVPPLLVSASDSAASSAGLPSLAAPPLAVQPEEGRCVEITCNTCTYVGKVMLPPKPPNSTDVIDSCTHSLCCEMCETPFASDDIFYPAATDAVEPPLSASQRTNSSTTAEPEGFEVFRGGELEEAQQAVASASGDHQPSAHRLGVESSLSLLPFRESTARQPLYRNVPNVLALRDDCAVTLQTSVDDDRLAAEQSVVCVDDPHLLSCNANSCSRETPDESPVAVVADAATPSQSSTGGRMSRDSLASSFDATEVTTRANEPPQPLPIPTAQETQERAFLYRCRALVMMGLPGSGKSSLSRILEQQIQGVTVVCQDELGSASECAEQMRFALKEQNPQRSRLSRVIVDMCNVQTRQRERWLDVAGNAKVPATRVGLVFLKTPPSLCRKRTVSRENHPTVPAGRSALEVVESFLSRFQPPTIEEGFGRVWFIDSKVSLDRFIQVCVEAMN